MPSSVDAVLVIIGFLMPGFIAGRIVALALPNSEPSEARLILTAIIFSCVNYALLSWLLVRAWVDQGYKNPLAAGVVTLISLFVAPVLLGLAFPWMMRSERYRKFREAVGLTHPAPKAVEVNATLNYLQ